MEDYKAVIMKNLELPTLALIVLVLAFGVLLALYWSYKANRRSLKQPSPRDTIMAYKDLIDRLIQDRLNRKLRNLPLGHLDKRYARKSTLAKYIKAFDEAMEDLDSLDEEFGGAVSTLNARTRGRLAGGACSPRSNSTISDLK